MANHSFTEEENYDIRLGQMTAYRWTHDPATVLFMLARYKWVAKMLAGYWHVLEVGCGDAFGSRIVAKSVSKLSCLDQDIEMLSSATPIENVTYIKGQMEQVEGHVYSAIYALDVLEHIEPIDEDSFMGHFSRLAPVGIIGMPSLESQAYASPLSKENHVNCKTEEGLRETIKRYYKHVFMFGMNDEIVTTGFGPMCQYRFALGVN